ncbi:hypothetical protein [Streptomyces melanogenes]|uniref:hypothetical protein n=1 Tax=Streptomyces melanogenes TaxID=67326 RepID=UPI003795CE3D
MFTSGSDDPDGSGFLFPLLTDRSPEAAQAHFEDYYERPVPLDAVRHALAGHPLTPAVVMALNPAASDKEDASFEPMLELSAE